MELTTVQKMTLNNMTVLTGMRLKEEGHDVELGDCYDMAVSGYLNDKTREEFSSAVVNCAREYLNNSNHGFIGVTLMDDDVDKNFCTTYIALNIKQNRLKIN